jgi:hypothetical protein
VSKRRFPAKPPSDLKAIHPRHYLIQDDCIWLFGFDHTQRIGTVPCTDHIIATPAKNCLDKQMKVWIVVYD